MATTSDSPAPGPPSEVYNIGVHRDWTVLVRSVKNKQGEQKNAQFKVDSEALKCFSEYFKASLRFNNKYGHEIVLQDENPIAIRVWLVYMHAALKHKDVLENEPEEKLNDAEPTKIAEQDQDALFKNHYVMNTNIVHIWDIINAGDKYLFDGTLLSGFFKRWYDRNVNLGGHGVNKDFVRQLALPCYMFDHAEGFLAVTKWLVYNCVGHITENRPPGSKWKHMHLCPPDFVRPLNHARGSLKTTLHRGIWEPVGRLLQDGDRFCGCEQWAAIAGQYFAALVQIDAYPLETIFAKASINEILSRLEDFEMTTIDDDEECDLCNIAWYSKVKRARERTLTNFDGVCMDCMNVSRPNGRNPDDEYWRKLGNFKGRWDGKCRVSHGQQTWYVSWCGRDEHRRQLIEDHKRQEGRD